MSDRSPSHRRKQTGSVFSQVHYEYLIDALRSRGIPPAIVVDYLCKIFAQDNPKFKPDLFRREIDR